MRQKKVINTQAVYFVCENAINAGQRDVCATRIHFTRNGFTVGMTMTLANLHLCSSAQHMVWGNHMGNLYNN